MKLFLLANLVLFLGIGASADLKPGDAAPDFNLPDSDGNMHTLDNYRDKIIALYFYPKNDTPGCTKQACSLRDEFAILEEKGVVVLGVSFDSKESHARFKEKYNLNFTLLSDKEKKTAKDYGTAGLLFAKRWTFLIDGQGKIIEIVKDVDTKNHAKQIQDVLKEKGKI